MKKHLLPFFALFCGATLRAADVSPTELKLRETLRNTMIQLRTAENDKATLQAAAADNDAKIKTLTDQVAALTKQSAADKDTSDKAIADLKATIDRNVAEIASLDESLNKWKASQKEAVALAEKKEAQRAKLAADNILLQRKVEDQQRKNDGMYKLGTEILQRYERFGLGDALLAREPFVGTTKAKFENLVQDFSDKLEDQKIKP